jgi:hypothetical protein
MALTPYVGGINMPSLIVVVVRLIETFKPEIQQLLRQGWGKLWRFLYRRHK